MASRQVSLSVNGVPIQIEGFVPEFIDRVVTGMLTGLKGAGEMHSINLSIKGEVVDINVNSAQVPVNPFVSKIFKNTTIGMVSSLKGVNQVDSLEISITK